ncbi:putative uncharacterized protein DDB_G0282133 [Cydia strobilella]|uniref:putative uncharacterized protein DDB_G0282133 n=1 Tax=Cydia strobilella TaxID=1100964 RepID=UPI003006FA85
MIGKILILATVAVANARHVLVENNGASTTSDLCPAEGHHLLPHEWDCTKFYYCEYGQKWVTPRDCAPGTEFSYEIQTCVHPDDANCQLPRVPPTSEKSEESAETEAGSAENGNSNSNEHNSNENHGNSNENNGSSEESGILPNGCPAGFNVHQLLPHESDCAKFYYCVFGMKIERDCALGTHFNPTLQVCDWPQNAGCANAGSGENESTGSADNGSSNEGNGNSGSNENHGNSNESNGSSEESGILPNGCPAGFNVHQLLPHESDCAKFYYCVFGKKIERDCAPGTHFNPTLQVCDWPQNAGCANAGSGENESTGSAENGSSNEGNGNSGSNENHGNSNESNGSSEESGILPNGCPADFNVHQLLPHESDCAKFYYCVFGKKIERDCAPGTHFNPTLQVCDWPQNAGCANAGSGENESNGSAENGNSNSNENNGNSNENNGSSEERGILPNGCPADFDVDQLLPHESDCTKYYDCVFGEKVERDCAPGAHFSAAYQACVRPEDAACANAGSGENESTGSAENGNSNSHEDNGNSNESNGSCEESGILPNGCPADFDVHQLLPHETNCAKFYYCVFGEKVERDCAPGTHFNPTLQVCDWPQNAGCANAGSGENESTGSSENGSSNEGNENSGSNENHGNSNESNGSSEESGILPNGCPADFNVHQLLPHESDCAKFYYCVFGEKVERDCAPGTHFNPTLQVCDWPQNAGCANAGSGENESTGSAENGSSNEENGNSGSNENHVNSNESNGSSEESGILPNGCPADFNVHQLLPHESNCAKFYYCVFGEKVERDCAPGTHFNPTLQVCDWPQNAGCANAGSGENESNGSAENGNSNSNENNGNSNENNGSSEESGILPNGCPADFDVDQLLPHESDCTKFYDCVFGEKVERDCAPGTHFNPTLQVCDWPQNAGCANAGSGENESTGSAENESSNEENGNSGSNENHGNSNESNGSSEESGILPNGCPADFNVHQLLPHESDCAKFYYCVFGEKVERDCAPGTHFNPTLQVCDWPQNAGCANAGSGENESNGSAENGNSNSNENNGNSNENNGSSEESGILPNGCPADFDVDQLLPHESDCTKFYDCVFGEKVERDCAPGTHFNPTLQVCDWPENAACANAGSDESGESNENNNGESGASESAENGSQEESDKCKTSCNVGAWAHEHDCDKFWRCDGENAVLGTCSEGLHFNVQTQTCDFICNANCVRDDVESTPEKEGLKLFLPWNKVDKTIRKLYLGHK